MLNFPAQVRIFAATAPVDFRKAHDGLVAIVRDCFREDPFEGSLFVFFNKKYDRVKLLLWDENGFWLNYKTTRARDVQVAEEMRCREGANQSRRAFDAARRNRPEKGQETQALRRWNTYP